MAKRPAPKGAKQEAAAAEYEDPGILADDSSGEDDVSVSGESSSEGTEGQPGLHDSGCDADAEAGNSSSDGEAAASPDDNDARQAAAGSDSNLDAGLDDLEQPDSSDNDDDHNHGLNSDSEGSSDRQQDSDDSADSDEGDEPSAGPHSKQQHASFLEGGKSASFAKAFAKIMAKPGKAAAAKSAAAADVILSESASMAKRKAEVAADEAAAREAKKQRLELKRRGHFKVPKKGEDPTHDIREKQLHKLATRGVVLLFNAVNKAQKQKRDAEAAGLKGTKALKANPGLSSKAGFFAELKAGAKHAVAGLNSEQLVPAAPPGVSAKKGQQQGGSDHAGQQQRQQRGKAGKAAAAAAAGEAVEAGGAGWDVLGEGFPGLTGGIKMKDWDKAAVSDEEMNGQALAGSDDDDGDDGW